MKYGTNRNDGTGSHVCCLRWAHISADHTSCCVLQPQAAYISIAMLWPLAVTAVSSSRAVNEPLAKFAQVPMPIGKLPLPSK